MKYPGSLHNHTDYSNLRLRDAIIKTENLIDYAIKLGHTGVAITEHEAVCNAIKAQEYYKEIKKKYPYFKLVLGNEIYLCRNGLTAENRTSEDDFWHFILLAKDAIGHKQIRELSSRAWLRGWNQGRTKRVPTYYDDLIEIVDSNKGHIIGSTACLGSYCANLVREKKIGELRKWLLQMKRLFGEGNFYLEMQPPAEEGNEQDSYNHVLYKLSKDLDIPFIVTTDSHYLKKEDAPIHKAYLKSQDGEREVDSFYATTYMMSSAEIESYFSHSSFDVTESYETIQSIMDSCEDYDLTKPLKIPELIWKEFHPKTKISSWYTKIPCLKNFYTSKYRSDVELAKAIVQNIEDNPTLQNKETYDAIEECLDMTWESSIVNKAQWSAYYLNLQKIIDLCWEAGSLVGPGRGSGVGFILLYVLGITQINPLRETTPTYPWRFLNPSRVSVLDVDFDIEGGRREIVLNKFREFYGQDRVSNVATFGTEKSKAAIQTACFEKGTLINTINGLKPIELITNQDLVYSSYGLERVVVPTKRLYTGELYTISTGIGKPFTCTENHQFLVKPAKRNKDTKGTRKRCGLYDPMGNLLKEFSSIKEAAQYYANNYNGSVSSMYKYKKHNGYRILEQLSKPGIEKDKIQWISAEKIIKEDKLLSYVPQEIIDIKEINFGLEEQNPFKKFCNYIKTNITLDEDFCELVGIILAEGNLNTDLRGVTITISRDEKNFLKRILKLFYKVFGITEENISILNKGDTKGLSIQVNSTPLGRFVYKYIYEEKNLKSYSKYIPSFIKKMPNIKQLALIKGFFLGDGYARQRQNGSFEAKLTTTSHQLALDLWELLARNGYNSSCLFEDATKKVKSKHDTYDIMIYGINAENLYNIKYGDSIDDSYQLSQLEDYVIYNDKAFYPTKIKSIAKSSIENIEVYCFQMPHSEYIVNNVITHNCRGLGISVDEALYISSFIPSDRGLTRTLHQCYYGDKENGMEPVKPFVQLMDSHPELWQTAQKIEGLVCRVGIHAGGVIFVDEPFTESTALMTAPDGTVITAYELHDCEKASLIKYDALSVEALDKIHSCLDFLVKYGYVEDTGNLRDIYEKTIGIYNLEREAPDMWDMVNQHKILSLFQMEKQSGVQGIALAKPRNIDDLATLNSVIRLMAPDKNSEQPLNKFARFRADINEWYKEMDKYGLTKEEQKLLEPILLPSSGMCESQEGFMRLVQIPECGGFDLTWADRLRKSIAKKQPKEYNQLTEEYFEAVKTKGLSKNLCNYVWNVLVATSRGYGFNKSHTLAYSLIALQEMNLAYKYPIIYWNTACLVTDSGGIQGATDYVKIAQSVNKIRQAGINISLVDINKSSLGFEPDEQNNQILFGLKGLPNINTDFVETIIAGRPYKSLADFYWRISPNRQAMVSLIKGGAFDQFVSCREEAMIQYLWLACDKKKRITLQNIPGLIRYDLIPHTEELMFAKSVFEFNRYLKNECKVPGSTSYQLDERAVDFLNKIGEPIFSEDFSMDIKTWEKVYKDKMDIFRDWIAENRSEILDSLNEAIFMQDWEKYAKGNTSAWEMEALGFYYGPHELKDVSFNKYGIVDFFKLPEEPIVDKVFHKGQAMIPIYKLFKIAGTVIGKNKAKSMVYLLTTTGVVTVKFRAEYFSMFDRQVSQPQENGTKKVIERSWFNRGNMIIVQGIRRGQEFVTKNYKSSGGSHQLYYIDSLYNNGQDIIVRHERNKGDTEDE